jgi:translocation and assembly module TamA
MLIYPGVSVNRTRSRGGLMPTWGDSQRYSVDYSNTMWGSDINFIVMQAQDVWIRTLYDRHRFVVRGNLGWIEADNFDKVPPDLRFFAGGDRSIRGYKYKSISPKDDDGKLIGASKLATGSLEYQYNVSGKWWGAVFVDSGEAVSDIREAILKPAPASACAGSHRLARSSWISPAGRRQRRARFTVLHRSGA